MCHRPGGMLQSFGSSSGKPNIIVVDAWREDTTPYNVMLGVAEFKRVYKSKAKLHLYGLPSDKNSALNVLTMRLYEAGVLGQAYTRFVGIERVYKAADMVVTPHSIATRIVREALACGTPIVAGAGCPYTQYKASASDLKGFAAAISRCWNALEVDRRKVRREARSMAVASFSMENQGKAMLRVFEQVLAKQKNKMVFV